MVHFHIMRQPNLEWLDRIASPPFANCVSRSHCRLYGGSQTGKDYHITTGY
jgi:hypothetical protein